MTAPFRLPLSERGEYPDSGRVALRGDRTELYALAKAGAEGWIRAQRYDPLDPSGNIRMVYVEWDKDHWAYNEQPDTWAFEDHYELANERVDETSTSDDNDDIRDALRLIMGHLGMGEETPPQGDLHEAEADDGLDSQEQYMETLKEAIGVASGGEAFLIVTVGRDVSGGRPTLAPHLFRAETSPEASVLVGAHMSHLGSLYHRELAGERINDIMSAQNPEPPDLVA